MPNHSHHPQQPGIFEMPVVPRHMHPLDAFCKFAKSVRFKKPKKRDFNITQIKSLVTKVYKEYKMGINVTYLIDQYEKWMLAYKSRDFEFCFQVGFQEGLACTASAFTNRFSEQLGSIII